MDDELTSAKGNAQNKADEVTGLVAEVSRLKAIQALTDQKSAEQTDEIRRLKDDGQAGRALADSRAQEVLKLAQDLATSQGEVRGLQVQNSMLSQDIADRNHELDRQRLLVDKLVEGQSIVSEKHAEQIERLIEMHHNAMERMLSEVYAGHVPVSSSSTLAS